MTLRLRPPAKTLDQLYAITASGKSDMAKEARAEIQRRTTEEAGGRPVKMRVIDTFSGIGGFSLGLERTGAFESVKFCEINQYCQDVIAMHWPDVPCHDDITTLEFEEGEADVICGGFPCQDVSLAGLRAGLAGARSGLYRELVRAIRVVRPRVAILENVAALLSDGMGTVLGDLAEGGACIEWDCVPAKTVGAPHERDRVWIIAHADSQGRPQPAISGEAERLRPSDGAEGLSFADNAADAPGEQVGTAGQSRRHVGLESSPAADAAYAHREHGWPGTAGEDGPETGHRLGGRLPTDTQGLRCGPGRTRRPPDSFARIRDEARRNAADPYGARLAFREGLTRDAWEKLTPVERGAFGNERQSVWPDEPALSGVDDGVPHWMDRVAATGNTIVPQIAELIGLSIADLYCGSAS